jgi:hypothetical protein
VDLSMDRLQSLHAVQCPWRKLVCSLPTVYACPARTKTAALEYLTERLDRLMEIQDQLPHIANESTAENNDDIIALLPETRRAVQADAMTLSKLLPLIINGWTVAAVHEDFDRRHVSVQCEYCYRTVLLNYSSAQFDPLRQHRWFCLAQHAYEQCDRRTLSQQLRAALFSTPLQSIESFRKPADAVHFVQDLLLRPHLMLHK